MVDAVAVVLTLPDVLVDELGPADVRWSTTCFSLPVFVFFAYVDHERVFEDCFCLLLSRLSTALELKGAPHRHEQGIIPAALA